MSNIKIGETVIKNVAITDSGDVLGMRFTTDMTLGELETLFTPATYPEFRTVNDKDEVVGVYKNRKFISVNVDIAEQGNIVNLVLQVTPAKIEEVELLTNQVNAQAVQIAEQANVIQAQADDIAEQANEISILKTTLSATQEELSTTQTALTETQATNDMLMECVLEMSEVVYA